MIVGFNGNDDARRNGLLVLIVPDLDRFQAADNGVALDAILGELHFDDDVVCAIPTYNKLCISCAGERRMAPRPLVDVSGPDKDTARKRQEARKKAFQRVRQTLQAHHVGVWGPENGSDDEVHCWLVRKT